MASRADLTTDGALRAELLLARRGQAYFSRKLNELSDAELDGPSRTPGRDRRAVIARVGLDARALALLAESVRAGGEQPPLANETEREAELALAATLPARALRHLSDHAAIHLSVEWRDLTDEQWATPVPAPTGETLPLSHTVRGRARTVWLSAVELNNHGSVDDFPDELRRRVLAEAVSIGFRS